MTIYFNFLEGMAAPPSTQLSTENYTGNY